MLFTWGWRGTICLSVWLEFWVPFENVLLIWRGYYYRWRATNFDHNSALLNLQITTEWYLPVSIISKSRENKVENVDIVEFVSSSEWFDIMLMVHFMSGDVNIPWTPWEVTYLVGLSKKSLYHTDWWYLTGFHNIEIFNYFYSLVGRRGGVVC